MRQVIAAPAPGQPATGRRIVVTDTQVMAIRLRAAAGERYTDIARSMAVGRSNVLRIATGKSRLEVGGPISGPRYMTSHAAVVAETPVEPAPPATVIEFPVVAAREAAPAPDADPISDERLAAIIAIASGRGDTATVAAIVTLTGIPTLVVSLVLRTAAVVRAA